MIILITFCHVNPVHTFTPPPHYIFSSFLIKGLPRTLIVKIEFPRKPVIKIGSPRAPIA